MIEELKEELTSAMDKAIEALQRELQKVRTGRATPNLLDSVKVDYYGTPTPVGQAGQISTPEARLIQIQPYDKTMIDKIERAIFAANLGLTPSNDGNLIRIPIPALTEEKRKLLVKDVKKLGEDSKIAIRNLRREGNDKIKKAEKSKDLSEDLSKKYAGEVQQLTDKYIKNVDQLVQKKEKDLMTV